MAPINGRPFLEHLLDYWISEGVGRFVLSVGYRHEVITGHFGNKYRSADIEYAVEEIPLGTGGGFVMAAKTLDSKSPFLAINGDTYFEAKLAALTELRDREDADWCFSLFRTSEPGRYLGLDVAEDGRIVSLGAGKDGGERVANGGVYLVHPRVVAGLATVAGEKLSLEDDVFPSAIESGQRLYGREFTGAFIDIGLPRDYHRAAEMLASRSNNQRKESR